MKIQEKTMNHDDTKDIPMPWILYERQEHVDLSTPCLIILVTINAMDIVWYYGVGGAPMEELILNAQYMWTHPPLV